MAEPFMIGHNPTPGTRLPYVLRLPVLGAPIVLATREPWPGNRDLYCFELDAWPEGAEVIEEVPVADCRRSGQSVQLVLMRRQRRRSLFVWVKKADRTLVFWRSERSMRASRPGVRVPQARGLDGPLTVVVDSRERYPWRFTGMEVDIERRALPVGDYAVFAHEGDAARLVATVERKTAAEFAGDAVSGKLGLMLAELAAQPRAALLVEGRLSQLLKPAVHVQPGWLMNVVAGLQAAYPNVPILFAESPKLAGDLAYRWLSACLRLRRAAREERSLAEVLGLDVAPDLDAGPNPRDARGSAPPTSGPLFEGLENWPPAQGSDVTLAHAPLAAARRRELALERARCGEAWSLATYAEAFGIGKATASSDLRELVRRGVLSASGNRRSLRFEATEPEAESSTGRPWREQA